MLSSAEQLREAAREATRIPERGHNCLPGSKAARSPERGANSVPRSEAWAGTDTVS